MAAEVKQLEGGLAVGDHLFSQPEKVNVLLQRILSKPMGDSAQRDSAIESCLSTA